MSKHEENLWQGIDRGARGNLNTRDYRTASFTQELSQRGVDAGELAAANRSQREIKNAWIPGVEIFARIGLWPKQWSAARMFSGTAKGFHVHPPTIPENSDPVDWLRRLYIDEPDNYSARSYDNEQWDVMFFIQGRLEIILFDIRAGLPRRVMRFFVDGDNHRSDNNVGIVIPPGVAHAIRVEGTEDVIMVYGTSTVFRPEFEGRIASDVETAALPKSWQKFLSL